MSQTLHDGNLFQLIAQNTSDLICIHKEDFSIIYATPSAERLLGYTPTELIGRRLTDFLDEDFKNDVDVDTLNVLMSRPGGKVRVRVAHRDGRRIWINTSFSELVESVSGPLLLTTSTDITESVNLLDDLMVALAKEKELSDLRANLYTIASHEFKTPLAVIQANVEVLERKTKEVETARKGLKTIQQQVDRLLELINDILYLKKLELGENPFNPAFIDLVEVAGEVWENEILPVYKGFRLELQVDGEPKDMHGDPQMIRYIMANLLANACKFSGRKRQIGLEYTFGKEEVDIYVRDEGIGIPEQELDAIFQPFFRGTNARNTSGSGIGLAIIKEFVALHNGRIDVKSKLGEGTVFHINFSLQSGSIR